MSLPKRFPPDDPREWMNRARSSLAMARSRVPNTYLEDLCFQAQQAAEKSIKALMIMRNVDFPYVHDIARLLVVLEASGESIPEEVRRASSLTRYAVATRYPGIEQPISEQQYTEAIKDAEVVIEWVDARLQASC